MTEATALPFDPARPARVEDRDALLKTINYVHRILKNSTSTIEADWTHIYEPANLPNVLIIRSGGVVAASVAIWPTRVLLGPAALNVGGINCLATLPDLRRHGLGSEVMRASHDRMRELGCHVGLLGTQITNWYRKLGWERAGMSRSYRFDRSNVRLLPALFEGIEARIVPEESAADVLPLRRADRLGDPRTPEGFRKLLAVRGRGAQIVAAYRHSTPVAYLMARGGGIMEWAGPADLVAGLVRARQAGLDDLTASTSYRDAAFRAAVQDEVTINTPAAGHPLIALLDRLRIPFSVGYVGMMRLLDPRGILDAFGVKDIAIEEANAALTLTRSPERVTLDLCAAAKLFFGPERVSDFAPDVFPLPFWQWPLESV